jgi:hypothetical protein
MNFGVKSDTNFEVKMRANRNEIRTIRIWLVSLASLFLFMRYAFGEPAVTKKNATKVQSVAKPAAKTANAVVPGARPSFLNTTIRKPATLDPNSAVEVRGQARTLSMMLVLKNGKDGINFIKVRKDYHPEIMNTDF